MQTKLQTIVDTCLVKDMGLSISTKQKKDLNIENNTNEEGKCKHKIHLVRNKLKILQHLVTLLI